MINYNDRFIYIYGKKFDEKELSNDENDIATLLMRARRPMSMQDIQYELGFPNEDINELKGYLEHLIQLKVIQVM